MPDKQSKLALLPLSRIKLIMKSSPEVTNISPDSLFLIAKAAEGFIAFMVRQALKASDNKMQVDYEDLAKVAKQLSCLEFLKDVIPDRVTGTQYLELKKKFEEEEKRNAMEDFDL